jgi:hypothetical protein
VKRDVAICAWRDVAICAWRDVAICAWIAMLALVLGAASLRWIASIWVRLEALEARP